MMMFDIKFWQSIKGFMDEQEARRLYALASQAAEKGPLLEIGSYCGKSAYVLGSACKIKNSILYSIDHHRGSEEQQLGEEYFDPELLDTSPDNTATKRIDTFPYFRKTIESAGLEQTVVPIVAPSNIAGRMWQTALAMIFIDGGHSFEAAYTDYCTWTPHLAPGGFLVFHDIFLDPEKGGQAPRQVYETAINSGKFESLEMTGTLGILTCSRIFPSRKAAKSAKNNKINRL
jgi:MMP 1-O-methyltransferase